MPAKYVLVDFATFQQYFGNVKVKNDLVSGKAKVDSNKIIKDTAKSSKKNHPSKSSSSSRLVIFIYTVTNCYIEKRNRSGLVRKNASRVTKKPTQSKGKKSLPRETSPTQRATTPPLVTKTPLPPNSANPTTAMISKVKDHYIDLDNPLSFTGDANKIMKQIRSFKYEFFAILKLTMIQCP